MCGNPSCSQLSTELSQSASLVLDPAIFNKYGDCFGHAAHSWYVVHNLQGRNIFLKSSVVDPNALNLDPDPEFCSNLDPDPQSSGIPVQIQTVFGIFLGSNGVGWLVG